MFFKIKSLDVGGEYDFLIYFSFETKKWTCRIFILGLALSVNSH